tara:strand:- start:148 stop:531 length:384 start_codon:yes stop_codon:yes gene_type:complete
VKASNKAACIFVKKNSETTDINEKTSPTAKAVLAEISPEGIGLNFVLSILESIILSCHILRIAAPEAPIAISNKETPFMKILLSEGAINIAHKAVKITKEITPGLIKTYICLKKPTSEKVFIPKVLE